MNWNISYTLCNNPSVKFQTSWLCLFHCFCLMEKIHSSKTAVSVVLSVGLVFLAFFGGFGAGSGLLAHRFLFRNSLSLSNRWNSLAHWKGNANCYVQALSRHFLCVFLCMFSLPLGSKLVLCGNCLSKSWIFSKAAWRASSALRALSSALIARASTALKHTHTHTYIQL